MVNVKDESYGREQLEQLQLVLKKYCLVLTGSTWEADDLAQEAWLKVLAKNGRGHANPEALLLRTAKNTWIDAQRRRQRWKRVMDDLLLAVGAHEEEALDSRLNIENAFHMMLSSLTPLQRSVLIMRSVLGYSIAETAKTLGTSEGAVKAAYFRAHKALKELREEEELRDEAAMPESDADIDEQVRLLTNAYAAGDVEQVITLAGQPHAVHNVYSSGANGMMMTMAA